MKRPLPPELIGAAMNEIERLMREARSTEPERPAAAQPGDLEFQVEWGLDVRNKTLNVPYDCGIAIVADPRSGCMPAT